MEQLWPIPVGYLEQFGFFLFQKGMAPSSIQGKMSALAFQAKDLGIADCTGDFRIHKMIEGWNKERIRTPDDRSHFSLAILMRFSESQDSLCSDRYEASLFQAATPLTFLEHFVLMRL